MKCQNKKNGNKREGNLERRNEKLFKFALLNSTFFLFVMDVLRIDVIKKKEN